MFPPLSNAQSLQICKVTQALIDAGCDVKVIAGKINSINQQTDKYFSIEKCEIHYVPYHEDGVKIPWTSLLSKIWRRTAKEFERFLWIKQAVGVATKIIEECKPHAILTASMPIDTHQVGLHLKRTVGIPWVASFSDPWPYRLNPLPYDAVEIRISAHWDMRLIRQILTKCNAVHMTNKYAIDLVEKGTNVPIKGKSWSIPHIGSTIDKSGPSGVVGWLAHIGELGSERLCKQLLEAIKEVSPSIKNTFIGLLCVGTVCIEFENMIKQMGVENLVKIMGQVSPEKAAEIMREAKALLVVEADMPMSPFLPSKFADYACAKRPIIAITPPVSAIRDYIAKYGGGKSVSHNTKEISAAIREVFLENECFGKEPASLQEGQLPSVFSSDRVGGEYIKMFRSAVGIA
jgi:glycosyltransferase involved in cell wall biosynthesis